MVYFMAPTKNKTEPLFELFSPKQPPPRKIDGQKAPIDFGEPAYQR